jgi:hypothetical protein
MFKHVRQIECWNRTVEWTQSGVLYNVHEERIKWRRRSSASGLAVCKTAGRSVQKVGGQARVSWKSVPWKLLFTWRSKWISFCTFQIYCPISVKFGTGCLHTVSWSCEFPENQWPRHRPKHVATSGKLCNCTHNTVLCSAACICYGTVRSLLCSWN